MACRRPSLLQSRSASSHARETGEALGDAAVAVAQTTSTPTSRLRSIIRGSRTPPSAPKEPTHPHRRRLQRSTSPATVRLPYRTREQVTMPFGPPASTQRDANRSANGTLANEASQDAPTASGGDLDVIDDSVSEWLAEDQRRKIAEKSAALEGMSQVERRIAGLAVQPRGLDDMTFEEQNNALLDGALRTSFTAQEHYDRHVAVDNVDEELEPFTTAPPHDPEVHQRLMSGGFGSMFSDGFANSNDDFLPLMDGLSEEQVQVDEFTRGLRNLTSADGTDEEEAKQMLAGTHGPLPEECSSEDMWDHLLTASGGEDWNMMSSFPWDTVPANDNNQLLAPGQTSAPIDALLCTAEGCPVLHPHKQGMYLAQGEVPRAWNESWGYSDPPRKVWEAWAAIRQGRATDLDGTMVHTFAEYHFWVGPEE